jgi:CBS domain-containing protein
MKTAAEVMNRSFFHASPRDSIGGLLHEMAERGLGNIPVLDAEGRPRGTATTAEIESCYDIDELADRLQHRAVCVDQNTPVDVAARALAQHPSCCLILVDASGVAVGALSPLELLGAALGCEPASASEHPHEREGAWSHAAILELGSAHRAPEAAGVILLSPGLDENNKRLVWAEATLDMRERLDQMLREPQENESLEAILQAYPRNVRFRCLTIEDEAQREQLADALCNLARERPCPARAGEPEASPGGATLAPPMGSSLPTDS